MLPDQFRVLAHRLGHGAEQDAGVGQVLAEGGGHGHAVEHGIHRHAGQRLLFLQGDAQLVVGIQQLRVHLVQALGSVALLLRRRVIGDGLEVDGRMTHLGPVRLLQGQPVGIGRETPFQQPFGLALLGGDHANDRFAQSGRGGIRLDIRHEAVLVARPDQVVHGLLLGIHKVTRLLLIPE